MLSAVLAVLAAMTSLLPLPAGPAHADPSLASLSPYPASAPRTAPVPSGYEPVFTESLDRHGSRTTASRTDMTLTLARIAEARAAGGLRDDADELERQVRTLQADVRRIGVGELTPVGEAELRGIGARVGLRLPGLLGPPTRVEIWSSGVQRASDSAEAFRSGLAAGAPSTSTGEVEADPRLLRFDKTDPEYARFLADDVAATQAIRQVAESAPVQAAATDVLERVFTPAYVSTLDDPAAAALSLWNLYAIVPGMGDATSADFSAFVSHSDAVALGTLHDADYFYRRGPSFSGQDDTYRAARVLLDDFFAAVHRRLKGGATAGVFRFAHAEQLIPFSALVGLPGSTQQVTPERPYSAADNPWRGGLVSPLGGNVQWDVFRDDRGRVLVRVLQNERQVPVAERCRPAPGTRLYYRLTELRRCLR